MTTSHGPHRRRHGDLVGSRHRLRKVIQRQRCVVPLDVIANDAHAILCGVRPLHTGPTLGGLQMISGEDHHGRPVTPGVVNRHGSVLQSDRPVREHGQRFAGYFEVAMSDGSRLLLVRTGQQLRRLVAAVVDDRLMDASEARAGIGRDVGQIQTLDDIDHEIRARIPDEILASLFVAVAGRNVVFHRLLRRARRRDGRDHLTRFLAHSFLARPNGRCSQPGSGRRGQKLASIDAV